jgi:hypothetical protein
MGRPKKSIPQHVEPDFERQEVPDEELARTLEPDPLPKGAVSQSDAARAALDAGHEKPAEAVRYIKDTFGIDMNPQYFSAIKTRTKAPQVNETLKKAAPATPKAKPGRKPKAVAPIIEGYVAPPEKPKSAGEPDVLLALEGVKELVSQFGADKVKRMVDLLG